MINGVGEKGNIGGNEALGEARRNGVQGQVDRNPGLADTSWTHVHRSWAERPSQVPPTEDGKLLLTPEQEDEPLLVTDSAEHLTCLSCGTLIVPGCYDFRTSGLEGSDPLLHVTELMRHRVDVNSALPGSSSRALPPLALGLLGSGWLRACTWLRLRGETLVAAAEGTLRQRGLENFSAMTRSAMNLLSKPGS